MIRRWIAVKGVGALMLAIASIVGCGGGSDDVDEAQARASLDEIVTLNQTLVLGDELLKFDPLIDPVKTPDENATTIASDLQRRLACEGSSVMQTGPMIAVSFGTGCQLSSTTNVTGTVTIMLAKAGDTTTATCVFATQTNSRSVNGTLDFATSTATTYKVTGTVGMDTLDLTLVGQPGAFRLDGTVQHPSFDLTLTGVSYRAGDCYPNAGTARAVFPNSTIVFTFDDTTAATGAVSVGSAIYMLPAYGTCPLATGDCDATTCAHGCCDGATCRTFNTQSTDLCGGGGEVCSACEASTTCTPIASGGTCSALLEPETVLADVSASEFVVTPSHVLFVEQGQVKYVPVAGGTVMTAQTAGACSALATVGADAYAICVSDLVKIHTDGTPSEALTTGKAFDPVVSAMAGDSTALYAAGLVATGPSPSNAIYRYTFIDGSVVMWFDSTLTASPLAGISVTPTRVLYSLAVGGPGSVDERLYSLDRATATGPVIHQTTNMESFAFTASSTKVYLAISPDPNALNAHIDEVSYDGSNQVPLHTLSARVPALTVDPSGSALFWSHFVTTPDFTIKRAALGGSPATLIPEGAIHFGFDSAHLYYLTSTATGSVIKRILLP
jgi:hypothetical protein